MRPYTIKGNKISYHIYQRVTKNVIIGNKISYYIYQRVTKFGPGFYCGAMARRAFTYQGSIFESLAHNLL